MSTSASISFRRTVLTLFILTSFIIIASYLLVLLMGFGFIFFTPGGVTLTMQSFKFYILVIFLIGFSFESNAGTVSSVIWLIYVTCFIAALKWRESLEIAVRKSFSRPLRNVFNNFLFAMPLISSMAFTAVIAIIYSQQAFGVPTGQPALPSEPQQAFLDLAYSPVIEEVGFRLIPIGLFMIFLIFSTRRTPMNLSRMSAVPTEGNSLKLVFTAIFYPDGAKKMAGLRNVSEHGFWRGIRPSEWIIIIATSAIFGYAHVLTGIGWEIGKVTSTFVQGFFFALTYIAYGFEAPILLHWFFNGYFYFFDPDIAGKFFPGTIDLLSVIELLIMILGILGWIAFTVAGLRRLLKRRIVSKPPESLPPAPLMP